jgi:hypothetical protein
MELYKPWKCVKVDHKMPKPKQEAIRSKGPKEHFTTHNSVEYHKKDYRKPDLDFIPYP